MRTWNFHIVIELKMHWQVSQGNRFKFETKLASSWLPQFTNTNTKRTLTHVFYYFSWWVKISALFVPQWYVPFKVTLSSVHAVAALRTLSTLQSFMGVNLNISTFSSKTSALFRSQFGLRICNKKWGYLCSFYD